MPVFHYTAKDLQGEYHKGDIETASESQAAAILRRKKLIVLSLKVKDDTPRNFLEKFLQRVPFEEVVVVTRQLATMIESGLVLSEALDILEEQQTNKRFKKVLGEIANDVRNGLDFASTIEKYPDIFPRLYSKLIRAGQASGKLDVILLDLANNLEKEREFKSKVKGAMIYPIVVISMMCVVMIIMVFFVMPKLTVLYKDSGMELPFLTKIMLNGANFIIGFWWALLILIITTIITLRKYVATPKGRLFIDTLMLKIPVVNKIITVVILTNFTRTFGLLISAGVSILESIKIVSDITGNGVYKNNLELSYQGVERGLSFSNQLLGLNIFPRIVGQMTKIGEETGKLDEIMFKMADYFESEADNSLKNITTLIEPLILLLLGIGVALLVISVIYPIYQISTNIN